MNGRVLSEEEIQEMLSKGDLIEEAQNLIATIRDRDKTIAELQWVQSKFEQYYQIASEQSERAFKAEQQNTTLMETLDRIDYLSKYYAAKLSCNIDKDTMEPLKLDPIAQEFADIVRETLAKVREKEVSPVEPNRNAQTE